MKSFKEKILALIIIGIMLVQTIPVFADYVNIAGIDGWAITLSNGCQGTAEYDPNVSYSGKNSLKLTNSSPSAPNVYMLAAVNVPVVKGRKYKYGATVKSENTQSLFLMIDWGERVNLLPFSKTYDFTKYEFIYTAEKTGTVSMQFGIDGPTDGIWFDDVCFIDTKTGENLVKNSGFELADETEEVDVTEYYSYFKYEGASLAKSILKGADYSVQDAQKSASMFGRIPAFYTDIKVDGKNDDWSDLTLAHMPIDPSQHQIYYNNENGLDLTVDYAFAYNDNYLYMYYDVFDNNHVSYATLDKYWQGDSIQLALSENGEQFGYEIGLIHDAETNSGKIYSSNMSESEVASCEIATSREGNHTVYEVAIPWTVKYGYKRDNILLDFIVNDNDEGERRYCVQLAKGIAEGKYNTFYPTLEMVPQQQTWFAWIDGPSNPGLNTEEEYGVFISNYGGEKTFVIKDPETEKNQTVRLKSGEGKRIPFTRCYTADGVQTVKMELECDSKSYTLTDNVEVIMPYPNKISATAMKKEVEAYAAELLDLINECKSKGISVDYEEMYYMTVSRFATYMQDDINHNDFERINFTKKSIDSIYTQAKDSLEKYLSGEKTPLKVPRFTGGDIKLDGSAMWAETETDGVKEYRPVSFTGFGHYGNAINEMKNFEKWGFNTLQTELGPTKALRGPSKTIDWSWVNNSAQAEAEVQTEVAHSGERALKITNSTKQQSNVYASLIQGVNVEPNTEYTVSLWIKGSNVHGLWISFNNYEDRVNLTHANDEWQQVTFKFTTNPGQYTRTIRIASEDITDEIYIDDLTCTAADGKNIVFNGDFEKFIPEGEEYILSESGLFEQIYALRLAEENNTSINLLLSPHYIVGVSGFRENHPDVFVKGGGALGFDCTSPEVRKMLEDFYRFVIPKIKDYKALDSFNITNEPNVRANQNKERFNDRWHEFLKNTHGTIENLNKLYKSNYNSFDEIEMPDDFHGSPVCVDYKNFNDSIMSEFHNWLASLCKELAPEIPVHVKIMPYMSSEDVGSARQNFENGTTFEYSADYMDMCGNDAWNFYEDSQGEFIKTMWYDFLHSIKDAPVVNSEDHLILDRSNKFSDEMDKYSAADIWQGGVHYRGITDIWCWERTYDRSSNFWGLELYRPNSVAGISKSGMDLMRLSYPVYALQKEDADIAVLYSDASRIYDSTNMNMMYEAYVALMCSGKKTDFVTEMQIEKLNKYKLIVVPGSTHVTEKTLDALVSYVKNGGKLLLIKDGCLEKTEYDNDQDAAKLQYIYENATAFENVKNMVSGLDGISRQEFLCMMQEYLKENGLLYVEVVDAETGKPLEKLEYTPAIYDDKLVINICNYETTRPIKISVGGETISGFTELRSMEKIEGDEITAEQYIPILIELDVDNRFLDTYGHWAKDDIIELYNKGLVSGVTDSRFNPNAKISNAEFVTMLARAMELKPTAQNVENLGIDSNAWYAGYMNAAYNAGILEKSDMNPTMPLTREKMCELLVKAYEKKNGVQAKTMELSFTDTGDITNVIAVSKACSLGFVNGRDNGRFEPKGTLTRAEAAAVILRFFNI